MPVIPVSQRQRGPRSLKRMALAVALRNIAAITDLGEMAFVDAKPILQHVDNPHQLHLLETNCPQFAAEPDLMAPIWSRLLSKKLPGWDTKGYVTDDDLRTMSWIDIYETVKDAVGRDMAAATARLQQTMEGFNKAKEDNAAQLINGRALFKKIPGVMAKRRAPGGSGPGMPSSLSFGSGSRTKMTSGQSVLRRARREAKEISKVAQLSTTAAHNHGKSVTAATATAIAARNQIRRAPEAMLNDYRVAHKPDAVTIRAPKRKPAGSSFYETSVGKGVPGTGLGTGNADHEARLLALKTGSARPVRSSPSAAATVAGSPAIQPPRRTAQSTEAKKRKAEHDAFAGASPDIDYGHYDDDDGVFGDDFGKTYTRNYTSTRDDNDDDVDDDDLFGDMPTKSRSNKPTKLSTTSKVEASSSNKRPLLTVEDLEDGYDDEKRSEKSRRLEDTRRPDRNQQTDSSRRPDKSEKRPPARASPPPPTYVRPAMSPAKGSPGPGTPARKKVDIFMRPKKR